MDFDFTALKKDGKKILLYYIGATSVIGYREKAFKKIRKNFQLFIEDHDNITVILTVDKNMADKVKIIENSLMDRLRECLESVMNNSDMRNVEEDQIEDNIKYFDAYYGDGSYLSFCFQQKGIPVMIQNINI
jgi:hypothetical protein